MPKRMLVMGLVVALAIAILTNCGGGLPATTPVPAKGTVISLIGDVPSCNVLSFNITISGVEIYKAGTTNAREVLPAASSMKLNLGMLRDFSTVLGLNTVGPGTYDKATLSVELVSLGIWDPTKNPPVTTLGATLTVKKPTFAITPPLTITSNKVSAIKIDLDMRRSIEVDSNGQVTGNVKPVFAVTPLTASATEGFGQMDDIVGFVRTVTTAPPSETSPFLGGMLMEVLSGSLPTGQGVNVSFTSSTQLLGVPGCGSPATITPSCLSQLPLGSFVEVDGYFDSRGNFVATTVQVEAQEDVLLNRIGLIGTITSLGRDANGNLTQLGLWVRGEDPDDSASIPLDTIVVVYLSSSTTYDYSSRDVNFAGLSFSPSALTVGQEVIVHGPFTRPTAPPAPGTPAPTTVVAEQVYLKLQSTQGNFSSLVQAGSDNLTGAFWFNSCNPLLETTPVLVITNSQTAFVNVNGLGSLTSPPVLLVKGLPFYQPQGGTINGVLVPGGTLVVLAKQVHQLQ